MKDKPLKILFYIKIFRQGGLESSLISWLNALDRKRFSPGLCITLPTHDFETWGRKLIPKDVPVHVIGSEAWTRAFYRQSPKGKIRALFSRTERILMGLLRKPILFWQLRSLAKQHDVICDFDLVSYKFAGRFGRPWIGTREPLAWVTTLPTESCHPGELRRPAVLSWGTANGAAFSSAFTEP